MERYIVAVIGGIIAAAALVYLIRLIVWQITGVKTVGAVVSVKEPKRGTYVHTLSYEIGGRSVRAEDKTGYTQPFSVGEQLDIVIRKNDPERFEYANALRKNIIVSAILVVMSVLIVLRFLFFVDNGEIEKDITMNLVGLLS